MCTYRTGELTRIPACLASHVIDFLGLYQSCQFYDLNENDLLRVGIIIESTARKHATQRCMIASPLTQIFKVRFASDKALDAQSDIPLSL